MCFSAQADVVVGCAVGVVGIDTLRHVTDRRQLPLASLPLVFAAHQLVEAFVWWGFDGTVGVGLAGAATRAYLLIAFVLPVVVPLSLVPLEADAVRRRIMLGLAGLGAVVSIVLVVAVLRSPPTAEQDHLHIVYSAGVERGGVLTVLYVVATCGAFLASSRRPIAVVGAFNLAAAAVLAWLTVDGVISLWCAWAAVASVLIAVYLRSEERSGSLPAASVA